MEGADDEGAEEDEDGEEEGGVNVADLVPRNDIRSEPLWSHPFLFLFTSQLNGLVL